MVVSVRGRSHVKTTAKRLWDEHSHPPQPRRLGPGPTPRSRERRPRPPPWAFVPTLGGPPGLPGPFPDEELGWGQGTQVLLGEQTEPGGGRPAGGVHASQPHGPTMSAAVPILGPGPGAAGSSAPERSRVGVPHAAGPVAVGGDGRLRAAPAPGRPSVPGSWPPRPRAGTASAPTAGPFSKPGVSVSFLSFSVLRHAIPLANM